MQIVLRESCNQNKQKKRVKRRRGEISTKVCLSVRVNTISGGIALVNRMRSSRKGVGGC
jgi:hypothetical protein